MTRKCNAQMRDRMPDPAKRQLRQGAGFGCCKCGCPILQYHHIVPYTTDDPHFRPEDMMVLCPTCHDMATKGALSVAKQRAHKENPYNIKRKRASGDLTIDQEHCAMVMGNLSFEGSPSTLVIDGEEIVKIASGEGGNLELSLTIYDQEDHALVQIVTNEWISNDPMPWDITADWQFLVIRRKGGDIWLSVNAKKQPIEIQCKLWRHGKCGLVNRQGITIDGERWAKATGGVRLSNIALKGIDLKIDHSSNSFGFFPTMPPNSIKE